MIGTIALVAAAIFLLGTFVGISAMGVYTWRTMGKDDIFMKVISGFMVGLGAVMVLLFIAVVLGQLKFEDVPNGCYRVTNHLNVLPTGKNVIVYNSHNYQPIPCP